MLKFIADHSSQHFVSATRWMGYSLLVGIAGGLAALAFGIGLNLATGFVLETFFSVEAVAEASGEIELANLLFHAQSDSFWRGVLSRWPLLFIPALGAFLSALVIKRWAPDAGGDGLDVMIRSFHQEQGRIPLRVPVAKMLASILTISSGGSAGREGPIALIGSGFASWIADKLKLSARETRLLIICGTAAGVGAIFRAPLGGAFFAISVLYREEEFEYEALIPSFLSSIIAYSLYGMFTSWESIFSIPEQLKFENPLELIVFVLVALILGLVGPQYIRFFDWVHERFSKMPVRDIYRPAIGGLCVGLISVFWPVALGGGYGWVQESIEFTKSLGDTPGGEGSNWYIVFLLALVAIKIVATSFTVGSGGSGGLFAPSLVIGGCLGGALGLIGHTVAPTVVANPEIYVLIGMAGFFSGVAKTPIAALIMVLEMTVGYGLLVPLMTVCAITYFVISPKHTIYKAQVRQRLDSPAHLGDFLIDVLERMKVRDIVKTDAPVETISESKPFNEVLSLTTESIHTTFPVVSQDGKYVGVLSYAILRPHLYNTDFNQLLIAADIMLSIKPLSLDNTLATALRRHLEEELEELPVVDPSQPDRVVGLITRHDIISAYHRQMHQKF